MSMNDTPKGERLQIALFGRRNAGKSSIINAITGQDLSIVSDIQLQILFTKQWSYFRSDLLCLWIHLDSMIQVN